jgi:hypothetical protein
VIQSHPTLPVNQHQARRTLPRRRPAWSTESAPNRTFVGHDLDDLPVAKLRQSSRWQTVSVPAPASASIGRTSMP